MRGSTSCGGGSRKAGTFRIATAAHQAAISATNTHTGRLSRATRHNSDRRRRRRRAGGAARGSETDAALMRRRSRQPARTRIPPATAH
jgi:hypothetical protein